jgi:peptide/nickel transport system substrate-binding protein
MGVEDGSDALMLKASVAERQAKARELLKQSGYDGKPIVLLHATNIHVMNQTMLVVAQNLRQVGFNVQLASTDWGAVVTRRSNQNPPDQGGWNVFYTWSGGNATSSPISLFAHAAIGKQGLVRLAGERRHRDDAQRMGGGAQPGSPQGRCQPAQQDHDGLRPRRQDRPMGRPGGLPRRPFARLLQVPEVVPWWNVERYA